MKIEDFDIIEANEAFAAQSVAVGKDLGIDVDILISRPKNLSLLILNLLINPQF